MLERRISEQHVMRTVNEPAVVKPGNSNRVIAERPMNQGNTIRVVYIETPRHRTVHNWSLRSSSLPFASLELSDSIYLDVDGEGRVLGAEFVNAAEFFVVLEQHGGRLDIPDQIDLVA